MNQYLTANLTTRGNILDMRKSMEEYYKIVDLKAHKLVQNLQNTKYIYGKQLTHLQ